jgi:formate/nitrite transporter FocA (FNT family)
LGLLHSLDINQFAKNISPQSLEDYEMLHALFFPTLLGNIVGGVSLVAALGHAQVVGGKS